MSGQETAAHPTPPHEHWEATFDDVLPQFQRALAGTDEISPARLDWLYRKLLYYRAEFTESWPGHVDFPTTIQALHKLRVARNQSGAQMAHWDRATVTNFERAGLVQELRSHLIAVVGHYEPGTPKLAELHLILAGYARHCREWTLAREHVERAADSLAAGDPSVADSPSRAGIELHLERSAIWIGVGLNEAAREELESARELAERLGDPELFGLVLLEELNLAVAVDAYHFSGALFERSRSEPWFAQLPDWLQAQIELRVAVGRAEQERREPELPEMASSMLEAVVRRESLTEAERLIARLRLASLWIDAARYEETEQLLDLCRESAEPVASHCGDQGVNRRAVDLAVLESRLALASGAPRHELQKHLDSLSGHFDSMLTSWRSTPESDVGLGLLHTRDRLEIGEVIVRLVLQVDGARSPQRALEFVERLQASGSLARALEATEFDTIEALPFLVPQRGGMLLLSPGANTSHLFCVQPDLEVSVHEMPPVHRLDSMRRRLLDELTLSLHRHAWTPALREIVAELSKVLLPVEVRERLRTWEALTLVGIDGIGYLPFELLELSKNERLGDHLALRYLPSLAVGARLRRTSEGSANSSRPGVALFATPDSVLDAATSVPLEFGDAEFDAWRDVAPFEWTARLSSAATLDALRAADTSNDFLLHLVAHGATTDDRSRPTGLVLAGEAGPTVLTPEVAETLEVPPVVVLTACGTWRGPMRRGDDGRHHFAGSLFLAGAQNVVLSSLEVEYRAHLELMREFYRALAIGDDPAHALHAARRARSRDPSPGRYLFHVLGPELQPRQRPAIARTRPGRGVLIGSLAGALLLALTLGGWMHRRQSRAK